MTVKIAPAAELESSPAWHLPLAALHNTLTFATLQSDTSDTTAGGWGFQIRNLAFYAKGYPLFGAVLLLV